MLIKFWEYLLNNSDRVLQAAQDHVLILVALPVGLAILISIPLGILATRNRWAERLAIGAASIIQTIPGLAMMAFMIPLGLGIGYRPAVVALFLYAILPILRNTYTGIRGVDAATREAAVGMGMTDAQVLWKVELPMAVPVIMAGIRTSTVIAIGTGTLAALIGGGGLGQFIVMGLGLVRDYLILVGAIPAALMALLADFLLGRLEVWVTPRGLRV